LFRIEIFCDDKKLSYILWALTGHVLGDPKIQPVVNAAKKNGKVRAKTSGKQMEMFAEFLKKLNPKTVVTSPMVREFCEKNGWKGDSCYYVVWQAKQRKLLKRIANVGKTGTAASRYSIMPFKEP
jgi:hypothetical protein